MALVRLAIPSEGEGGLDGLRAGHFGHCDVFTCVDIEHGKIGTVRIVAIKESVTVMGTIGLLCAMVENQLLTVDEALKALHKMKEGKRRLPWPDAEKMLEALR